MKNIFLLLIFLLTLSIRLVYIVNCNELPTYDQSSYDEMATSISEGEGYKLNGAATAFKVPFYSMFLGGIYYIFGHKYIIARIIQSIIGTLICIIVYFISKELFGFKIGVLSAFIISIYPPLIKIPSLLLSENLFIFLLSFILWALFYLKKRNSLIIQILIGVSLGLTILTRGIAIFLPIVIYLILRTFDLERPYRTAFVVFFFLAITISPWILRNYLIFGRPVLSTEGGRALYASWCPPKGKIFGLNPVDDITEKSLKISSEIERDTFLYKKALENIFSCKHFKKVLYLEILKILFFWCPFDWEILGGRYNFGFGFIIPFFIYGVFLGCTKRYKDFYGLLLVLLYFQIFALIFYGSPRFRLPIEPLIIIIASFGLVKFFEKFRKKFFPVSILLLYAAINIVFYLYSGYTKEIAKNILVKCNIW